MPDEVPLSALTSGGLPIFDLPPVTDERDESFAESERPSIRDSLNASARSGVIAGIVDRLGRPDFPIDPNFNPYKYASGISDRFSPAEKAAITELASRGVFDDTRSESEFWYEVNRGRTLLQDEEAMGSVPFWSFTNAITMFRDIGGDPTNLIPAAALAKFAGTSARAAVRASTAARVGVSATAIGAYAVVAKETGDALLPGRDPNSYVDELMTFGIGAALGAGIGAITAPSLAAKLELMADGLDPRSVQLREEGMIRYLKNQEVFAVPGQMSTNGGQSSGQPGIVAGLGADASFMQAGGFSPEEARSVKMTAMDDAYAESRRQLQAALDEDPVGNRVVYALYEAGDENDKLRQQVIEKYEKAGVPLGLIEPPDQIDTFRKMKLVQRELSSVSSDLEASRADLGDNRIGEVLGKLPTGYGKVMQALTPGGRLANATLSRVNSITRAFVGSMQTISKGSARDPLNFDVGSVAEGMKHRIAYQAERVLGDIRTSYLSARREGRNQIRYDGRVIPSRGGSSEFRNAVADYMTRLDSKQQGFSTIVPDDVDPAIKAAAEKVRQHLDRMGEMLETAELLDGKVALEAARKELATAQSLEDAVRAKAASNQFTVATERLATAKDEIAKSRQRLLEMRLNAEASRRKVKAADSGLMSVSNLSAIIEYERRINADVLNKTARNAPGADDAIAVDVMGQITKQAEARMARVGPPPIAPAGKNYNPFASKDVRDVLVRQTPDFFPQAVQYEIAKILGPNKMPTGRKARFEIYRKAISRASEATKNPNLRDEVVQSLGIKTDRRLGVERDIIEDDDATLIRRAINDIPLAELPVEVQKVHAELLSKSQKSQARLRFNLELLDKQIEAERVQVATLREWLKSPEATFLRQRPKMLNRRLRRMENRRVKAAENVDRLEKAVERRKDYLPRVYLTHLVMDNQAKFIQRAKQMFQADDLMVNGKMVDANSAPLRREIVERLSRDDLAQIAGLMQTADDAPDATITEFVLDDAIATMTRGDLPADIRLRYEAELDQFFESMAKSWKDKLIDPKVNGVVDAMGADPLKARVIRGDVSYMAEFMDRNIESLVSRYTRHMSGLIASRRAIQLNPRLANATLLDGTRVKDGDGLVQWATELADAMHTVFARAEEGVVEPGKRISPKLRAQSDAIKRDIEAMVGMVEGTWRPARSKENPGFFDFLGRNAIRMQPVTKLGSVIFTQMSELGPIVMHAMMDKAERRAFFRGIASTIPTIKNLPREDLKALGLWLSGQSRVRALTDLDEMFEYEGFGHGRVKAASQRIDRATQGVADFNAKVTLMEWSVNTMTRLNGHMVLSSLTNKARQVARMADLVDGGMSVEAAAKKVKLGKYELARANKLGLNAKNAKAYNQQVYKHGILDDGTERPINSIMSFEEFMESKRGFLPNFEEWTDRRLLDQITSNVNVEVSRGRVVTPGIADTPLANRSNTLVRMINQFQSYATAFANQRIRPNAQLPWTQQAGYLASYMFLGAMSDAVQNHLSGRRSLDETATLWQDNPLGMMYAAWNRSGLSGWVQRPMAIGEAAGMPFTPGVLFNNTVGSGALRHVQSDRILTSALGPVATDFVSALNVTRDLIGDGDTDRWTAFSAWKLAPFQNFFGFRVGQQFTDFPITPERLVEPLRKNLPPRP